VVAGRRAHVFGVASTAVAARSVAGISYARQRRSRRGRRTEGVERSATFLVLAETPEIGDDCSHIPPLFDASDDG
jgi:hypothetical protein